MFTRESINCKTMQQNSIKNEANKIIRNNLKLIFSSEFKFSINII